MQLWSSSVIKRPVANQVVPYHGQVKDAWLSVCIKSYFYMQSLIGSADQAKSISLNCGCNGRQDSSLWPLSSIAAGKTHAINTTARWLYTESQQGWCTCRCQLLSVDESAVRLKTEDLTCCHLMNSLIIKQLCLTICGEIIKACDIPIHYLSTAPEAMEELL